MIAPPVSVVPERAIADLCGISAGAPAGAFVEIGVYKGGTAWHLARIARAQGRALYLYDTFTGIPFQDQIDAHPPGDFGDTTVEQVRRAIPDANVVVGVFPDSLIAMPPVAFVHADCDQYRSVKAVCETMPRLMVRGGLILFDDFNCLDGATAAVKECFAEYKITAAGKALVTVNRED